MEKIEPKLTEQLRYHQTRDIEMRLHGTLLRWEGEPVRVYETRTPLDLLIGTLPETGQAQQRVFSVHSSDIRLDISSPPLGYVNFGEQTAYGMRMPSQNQAQGIRTQNLVYIPLERMRGHDSGAGPLRGIWPITYDLDVAIAKTVTGRYPSLEQVSQMKQGAFGRRWAMRYTKDKSLRLVFNRGECVGVFVPNEKRFVFSQGRLTNNRSRSLNRLFNKTAENFNGGPYEVEESQS